MLQDYLQRLGFAPKEQRLYLMLVELGVQPASVIARQCGLDRITAYKHLKKLSERGFVKVYSRDGIQCFGVEDFDAIEQYLSDRRDEYGELLDNFSTAANVLKSLKHSDDVVPRLQMFEGQSGIKSLFRDILFTLKQESVHQIRILSSNTFEEWQGDSALQKTVRSFFYDLKAQDVSVEVLEATGGLVPERLQKITDSAEELPIVRGTTAIILVGTTVYLATYKGSQMGLKITQREVSQVFHFVFDLLGARDQ